MPEQETAEERRINYNKSSFENGGKSAQRSRRSVSNLWVGGKSANLQYIQVGPSLLFLCVHFRNTGLQAQVV